MPPTEKQFRRIAGIAALHAKRRESVGVAESIGLLWLGRLEGVENSPDAMRLGELDLAPNQNRLQVFLHRLRAMKGNDVLEPVGLSAQVFSCVEILRRAVDSLEN